MHPKNKTKTCFQPHSLHPNYCSIFLLPLCQTLLDCCLYFSHLLSLFPVLSSMCFPEIALDKVINDLDVSKSSGQLSVFILLDQSTAYDPVHSLFYRTCSSHGCKDTVFWFPSYFIQWLLLLSPLLLPCLPCFLTLGCPIVLSLVLSLFYLQTLPW